MSSPAPTPAQPPLQLDAKWRRLPAILIGVGVVLGIIGLATNTRQFGYSYLTAFMFFLSLCLGGLFLTLIHHLFDAQWSVPLRRVNEHLGFLLPVMAALFIPIAVLAPEIYPWMKLDPHADHALHAKQPLFTKTGFYAIAAGLFLIWTWLTYNLRKWSLRQDATGSAECTYAMRKYAAGGIFIFALSLTLAAIMWMKGLEHQWFSTMFGVYYFAGSVWTTVATVYLIALVLQRTGPLAGVVRRDTFHDTGKLFFAFTVFYAYINFSQYFLIWNAAIPEETFYYVKRENGSWWDVGMLTVFGHFLLPFLAMLRIDAKLTLPLMIPLCLWAWVCHYWDMQYNIMPVLHPDGVAARWLWLDFGCLAFIGGVLSLVWLRYFKSHPPYPVRDPRLGEALGVHFYDEPETGKAHH
ncbi:MAG TPA: hypothetical protein VNO52_13850 [Methylomirabilota bacterium]|nr:hypothetical protein [Methylomirabilota bacterium]